VYDGISFFGKTIDEKYPDRPRAYTTGDLLALFRGKPVDLLVPYLGNTNGKGEQWTWGGSEDVVVERSSMNCPSRYL